MKAYSVPPYKSLSGTFTILYNNIYFIPILTLMLVVANLVNIKWCKKTKRMTETLAHRYSSVGTQ